jgi:hypothetical protein
MNQLLRISILISFMMLYRLNAQTPVKTELLSNCTELGFYSIGKEVAYYLFKGAEQGKIKAYAYQKTNQTDFSHQLSLAELKNRWEYYEESLGDTINFNPKNWHLEIQRDAKQDIKALVLIEFRGIYQNPTTQRIVFKYSECKQYLNDIYQNSLQYNKIDKLEAVWVDLKDKNRRLPICSALEQYLYQGIEKTTEDYNESAQITSGINNQTSRAQIITQSLQDKRPFMMQNAPNEQHTVLYRRVDFNVSSYPFIYNDFDKLPLLAQLDSIQNFYQKNRLYGQAQLGATGSLDRIDSSQYYYLNQDWTRSENHFINLLYQGIQSGKIKLYQPETNSFGDGLNKRASINDLANKLNVFDNDTGNNFTIRADNCAIKWKEYYYTDMDGNPSRSEIELVTLFLPAGTTPFNTLGDLDLVTMKFSDIKSYFEHIFQTSNGRLGGIKGICMTTALEKHLYHTSTVYYFFNPFGVYIPDISAGQNSPITNEKWIFEHALRTNLKDNRNNITDLAPRSACPKKVNSPSRVCLLNESRNVIPFDTPLDIRPSWQMAIQDFEGTIHHKWVVNKAILTIYRDGKAILTKKISDNTIETKTLKLKGRDRISIVVESIAEILPDKTKKTIDLGEEINNDFFQFDFIIK